MRLPVVSGRDVIRVLSRFGWSPVRQKGSHVSLYRPGARRPVTVPLHAELDIGTLRRILRHAGVTVDEFVEALKER